jgi:hypothetical protein
MKVDHRGGHHLLDLESVEVALLLDILEAALETEAVGGAASRNPPLARVFNALYSGLLDTAREVWCQPASADPACPQGSAEGSPACSSSSQGRSMPPGRPQIPSPRRRARPSSAW